MKKILLAMLFALILSIPSYAHPGNTDSYGGHTCKTNCSSWGLFDGQYHYHNSSSASCSNKLQIYEDNRKELGIDVMEEKLNQLETDFNTAMEEAENQLASMKVIIRAQSEIKLNYDEEKSLLISKLSTKYIELDTLTELECVDQANKEFQEQQKTDLEFLNQLIKELCPLNSTFKDDGCYCDNGYVLSGDKKSCTLTPVITIPPKEVTTNKSFNDIETTNPFNNAIAYLKKYQIVDGYADGSFKPSESINRAEFMKIIVEAIADNPHGSECFTDIKDEWYASYVCYAKDNNIISGYSDGTFKPNKSVNLGEALKITMLALKIQLSDDIGTNWYDVYFNTAMSKNIFTNIGKKIDHDLTRGEMAELIYKLKN